MDNDFQKMTTNPFEPYGAELAGPDVQLSPSEQEERRLCSIGSRGMLGFQCSCSS